MANQCQCNTNRTVQIINNTNQCQCNTVQNSKPEQGSATHNQNSAKETGAAANPLNEGQFLDAATIEWANIAEMGSQR